MTSAFDVAFGRYCIGGGGLALSRTDLNKLGESRNSASIGDTPPPRLGIRSTCTAFA